MKKSELRWFIQIYAEMEKALLNRSETVEIKRNRRIERIKIKSWMYRLPEYLALIEQAENYTIREIIKRSIRKGERELKIIHSVAVSESTYYRWKKQILDKIYDLYILSEDVTLEEILSEKID